MLTQRCTRRYILVIKIKIYETRNDLKRSHLAREIVETIALTLIIFLVIRFAIQSYRVEGVSMQPGLQSDQYVLVNKMAYLFHAPERGDVIVFHFPLDTSKDFIKRVIGLPGDTISYTSTTVQVNGVVLNEPYISEKANPLGKNPFVVPPNEYFVMGDNRPASDDSRDWGYVPKDYIVGKAVMVYWPLNKWQLISTYPTVFGQIKSNH
jgi:signal peptidase I